MGYIIVIGIVYLCINIVIASMMQNIAELKGYEENRSAFVLTLLLGIVGVLYVVALPDKKLNNNIEKLIQCINKLSTNNITDIHNMQYNDKEELPPL